LEAIESGVTGETLGAFFAPGVEFVVFPNLLLPKGDRHKLAGALEGAERGRKLMAGRKYLITHEMAEGKRVALEVEWTGALAVSFGALPAGSQMKAYFAMFLESRRERSLGSGITIVSRDGDPLGTERGRKYDGTVLGPFFMVPFRHCPRRGKLANFGLCGQGLCWSHRFCSAFVSAHC
jgi:hypothetical protein